MADEVLGDVLVTLPAVDMGEGEAEAVASGERQGGSQEREPEQQYEHRLTEKKIQIPKLNCDIFKLSKHKSLQDLRSI